MKRIFALFFLASLCATTVWGDTIARDSYLAGSPAVPATGEYIYSLSGGQNPTIAGFPDAWIGTTGTLRVSGSGLDYPDMGALGSKHQFTHTASLVDYRSVSRVLDTTYDLAAPAYYMAGLMSFDELFGTDLVEETNSIQSVALTQFLNAEDTFDYTTTTPNPGAGSGLRLGMEWGFQGDGAGGVNAIVRTRNTIGDIENITIATGITAGTHLFVAKVEPDFSGSQEQMTVWFDPTDLSSESAAAPTIGPTAMSNWVVGGDNASRIVDTLVYTAENVGANAVIGYDEFRFATSWDDLFAPADVTHTRFQEGAGYEHVCTELRPLDGGERILGESDEMLVGIVSTGMECRSALSFDLSSIPEGAEITAVNLALKPKRFTIAAGSPNGIAEIGLYVMTDLRHHGRRRGVLEPPGRNARERGHLGQRDDRRHVRRHESHRDASRLHGSGLQHGDFRVERRFPRRAGSGPGRRRTARTGDCLAGNRNLHRRAALRRLLFGRRGLRLSPRSDD